MSLSDNKPATDSRLELLRASMNSLEMLYAREGYQLTNSSIGGNNSAGALAIGALLGGVSPPPGAAYYVESITMASAIDAIVWVQRMQSGIVANSAAPQLTPVAVGPGYGAPTIPVNAVVREGESITFILRTAIPDGGGTDTFQFRAGFTGHRITNDFAYERPSVMLVIGDSISNTTGVSYGSEYYHARFQRGLIASGKSYRRIVKGDGGWKMQHALVALKRGLFDVPRADLILLLLGTNESSSTDYSAALPSFFAWKQDLYPKSQLIVLGPPPRQGSVDTTVLAPIRSYASGAVAALDDPLVHFVDLGSAFSTVDDTYFFTADGTSPGSRVHPNAAGHTAMAEALAAGAAGLDL